MNHDDLHSLAGAYVVDAVDDVERVRFEAHLAGCSQCQTEVASLRAAAGELSSTTVSAPPPSLRASVLRDISSVRPLPPEVASEESPAPKPDSISTPSNPAPEPPLSACAPSTPAPEPAPSAPAPSTPAPPPSASAPSAPAPASASLESRRAERARRVPVRQWLAGVAAAAILATGGLVWHPWSPDTGTVQLTATQEVLQAKDAQRFEQRIGAATATIVRSPSLKKAVIVTANLPAAPEGKVYELWLKQGTTLVPAGLMPAGQANTVMLKGDAASAQAVGLTVEPAGGSDTPTLPPLAVINLA